MKRTIATIAAAVALAAPTAAQAHPLYHTVQQARHDLAGDVFVPVSDIGCEGYGSHRGYRHLRYRRYDCIVVDRDAKTYFNASVYYTTKYIEFTYSDPLDAD